MMSVGAAYESEVQGKDLHSQRLPTDAVQEGEAVQLVVRYTISGAGTQELLAQSLLDVRVLCQQVENARERI